jgi:cation transport regulator ChaC
MQTAVNWMIEELIKKHVGKVGNEYVEIFEQAKEMEKQQITDAWDSRNQDVIKSDGKTSEQYYNETFKKDKL